MSDDPNKLAELDIAANNKTVAMTVVCDGRKTVYLFDDDQFLATAAELLRARGRVVLPQPFECSAN